MTAPLFSPGRNIYIHGLRGALALGLFFFHVANSGLASFDNGVWRLAHQGFMCLEFGVELFFGISGIVMIHAFRSSRSIGDFLLNRVTRIFPVLWVTVLLIAGLTSLDPRWSHDLDALTLLANLLALPPLFPGRLIHPAAWSISYEFAFYLMFVLYAILTARVPGALARALVCLVATYLLMTHLRAFCFVTGMWIVTRHRPGTGTRLDALAGVWLFLAMYCWHLSFKELEMPWDLFNLGSLQGGAAPAVVSYLAGIVFAYCGLSAVFRGAGLISRVLATRVVQWLGTISFSLYLWQTLVMAIVKRAMVMLGVPSAVGDWSQLVFLLVSLPVTLLVAHWSQAWLERDLTNWLRRKFLMGAHAAV